MSKSTEAGKKTGKAIRGLGSIFYGAAKSALSTVKGFGSGLLQGLKS